MKLSPLPCTVSELSEAVSYKLNLYALAASAAGVGLLALARPLRPKLFTPRLTT